MENVKDKFIEVECIKCHHAFQIPKEEDSRALIPLCDICLGSFTGKLMEDITSMQELLVHDEEQVDSFMKFITSTGYLMKIGESSMIEACFNIFIGGLNDISEDDPAKSLAMFIQAKKYIDIEMEKMIKKIGNKTEKESPVDLLIKEIFDRINNKDSKIEGNDKISNNNLGKKYKNIKVE